MATYLKPMGRLEEVEPVENPPGIFRKTLSYNDHVMICHFTLQEGAEIPKHNHSVVQAGYVIKGKLKFYKQDGSEFIATTGTSYAFEPDEFHAVDILEESEVLECFTPVRPEYIP